MVIPTMESVKETNDEIMKRFFNNLDENSSRLSSCELRVMLLDILYAK
jgi:hypothetical protein